MAMRQIVPQQTVKVSATKLSAMGDATFSGPCRCGNVVTLTINGSLKLSRNYSDLVSGLPPAVGNVGGTASTDSGDIIIWRVTSEGLLRVYSVKDSFSTYIQFTVLYVAA